MFAGDFEPFWDLPFLTTGDLEPFWDFPFFTTGDLEPFWDFEPFWDLAFFKTGDFEPFYFLSTGDLEPFWDLPFLLIGDLEPFLFAVPVDLVLDLPLLWDALSFLDFPFWSPDFEVKTYLSFSLSDNLDQAALACSPAS